MKKILNRELVLRDEGARHPFRLALPRHILQIADEDIADEADETPTSIWKNEDAHLFTLSFLAFFTAFYLFIF